VVLHLFLQLALIVDSIMLVTTKVKGIFAKLHGDICAFQIFTV
jgi:hypothetical protein